MWRRPQVRYGLLWALWPLAVLLGGPAEETFEQLVEQARQAERARDYARAGAVYAQIVKLRPDDPVANRNLGLAFYLQSLYPEAIAPLEKALKLDPELPGAALYLGISYYRVNQFHRAADLLEQARALAPQDGTVRYWLGASRLALGAFPEAIGELEAAAEASPDDLESAYLLARAYAGYAAALLERLLRAAPDSAAAHRLRAEDALAEGLSRAAIVELERALEKRPRDAALERLLEQARSLEAGGAGGDVVAASDELPPRSQLHASLEQQPDHPDSLYRLGKFYENAASGIGHKLFLRYPDSYRVRLMRGEAFERSTRIDYEAALAEYRKALELEPDLPGVSYSIGRVLWKMRLWEQAVPYLEAELARNPNHALANYYLGSSYLLLERLPQAIRYLEAAVRNRPELVQAHRDLGRAHAKAGSYEAAIDCYQRAAEADPGDPSIHALMAAAYRAMGRLEDARRSVELERELRSRQSRSGP